MDVVMNDIIKALAKDHLLNGKYNGDGAVIEGDYYEFEPDELVKFVELIVRDCINIVERHGSWIGVDYIKEHFGVEE